MLAQEKKYKGLAQEFGSHDADNTPPKLQIIHKNIRGITSNVHPLEVFWNRVPPCNLSFRASCRHLSELQIRADCLDTIGWPVASVDGQCLGVLGGVCLFVRNTLSLCRVSVYDLWSEGDLNWQRCVWKIHNECVLLCGSSGDLNVDTAPVRSFNYLLFAFDLRQTIISVTRVLKGSQTIIDNIFTISLIPTFTALPLFLLYPATMLRRSLLYDLWQCFKNTKTDKDIYKNRCNT